MPRYPRVLIVAEHASAKFGGEAVLPLHYFRLLRERGVDAYLLVHERTRKELDQILETDRERITYVPDTRMHLFLFALCRRMPARIADVTVGLLLRLLTQWYARSQAVKLIRGKGVQLVHQPIPVSPKEPSVLSGLGVPVVIGPMNGGMSYPPGFDALESRSQRVFVEMARRASHLVHRVLRGKLDAATLLVANERTRSALPKAVRGRIEILVENGVDLRLFDAARRLRRRAAGEPLRAVFVGRLIALKALDVLLEALVRLEGGTAVTLDVLGDGPMREQWETKARALGLGGSVRFLGFVPQGEVAGRLAGSDVLVLPSLRECGGAVVLEAMALGLPVVATAWGGPPDYLDRDTGILVPPTDREALRVGFAAALRKLAENPELAARMGERARMVVAERFDWRAKIVQILVIYDEAIARFCRAGT